MFCENCGKLLNENEKICPVCGMIVEENESFTTPTNTSKSSVQPKSTSNIKEFLEKNKKTIIIIGAAILLVIIIIAIVASISNRNRRYDSEYYTEDNNYAYSEMNTDEPSIEETELGTVLETTEYQPSYTTLDISPIEENEITIDSAKIDVYKGNITKEEQVDEYSFTVPRDGRYRFELSEVHSGTRMDLKLINSLGEAVATCYGAENGDGMTVKDLEADDKYTIKVIQNNGTGSYNLSIGNQKKTTDVTDKTKVIDSIEFTDQRNVYKFVVPRDGRYHFELSEVHSGTKFEFIVFDHLGETVGSSYGAENGDGITVKDLKQGDEYEIQIRQYSELGSYQLLIGCQKEIKNVSPNTVINDSIEYTDQRNVYNFECNDTSTHTVTISGLNDSCSVELKSFNHLGESISTNYGARNGDEITVSDNCTIQVVQYKNTSKYTLTIDW